MSKNETQINIFAFDNYRDFLKAFYEYKKSLNSRYSYRVFCNKAGISSTSYLNMIMHGKRNLTQKSIPKFVKGLSLKGNEKKYFENLVLYNQSTDQELRSEYFQRLLFLRSEKFDVYKLGYNQHAFLSKWYAVAIYEFLDTKNNCHSAKLIADKLKGGVTEEDVKESLTLLKKLGLIKKDPSKGYVKINASLETVDDNILNDAKFNYHKSMIDLTKESLEDSPVYELRELSALTFAVDSEKLPEIIKKMKSLIRDVNKVTSKGKYKDKVYQLNLSLFGLSK
tara:strand:+ start:17067 stop:17909 length:843 start_codon:yes stop_codon:yes gene_type:complete